jgi:hypothetical protein
METNEDLEKALMQVAGSRIKHFIEDLHSIFVRELTTVERCASRMSPCSHGDASLLHNIRVIYQWDHPTPGGVARSSPAASMSATKPPQPPMASCLAGAVTTNRRTLLSLRMV